MNQSSKKMQQLQREYTKLRKEYLSDKEMCNAKLHCCTLRTTDVHHMAGRIGEMLLYKPYWLPVCRGCHDWIEAHPIESKEMGFSMSKTNTDIPDGKK